MAWLYVFAGGLLEIPWVMGLKYADNFWTYALVAAAISLSFFLLTKAYDSLPVGVVYAVFTGVGTVGIVLTEAVINGGIALKQVFFIAMIASGVIGLKITGKGR